MDPWRLTTTAQRQINALAGVALASCVLAWLAGFSFASSGNSGEASIENAGAKSIVERHDPPLVARTEQTNIPQVIALASASIGDVDIAPAALSLLDKASATTADAYRYEPISLFEISLTDPSQTLPPEHPSRRRRRTRLTRTSTMSRGRSAPLKSTRNVWSRRSASIDICGRSTNGRRRSTPSRSKSRGK